MSAIKREPFKSAPRTFRKKSESQGRKYNDTPATGRFAEGGFREERSERRPPKSYGFEKRERFAEGGFREERSERRPPRPYGFEKREREPMHVIRRPPASQETNRPVHVSADSSQPIAAYKLKKGFEAAQGDILDTITTIANTLSESGNVIEVELSASFNSDGRFIGFGAGGAATMKIRISPTL